MLPAKNDVSRRAGYPTQDTLTCFQCRKPYRHGELMCANCGALFFSASETRQLDGGEPMLVNWSRGDAILTEQRPILFEIDEQDITLPIAPTLIIGRAGSVAGDAQPDVDLSQFDAKAKGVSRLHLRLVRKSSLIYVADMGSSNGSHLNGRRMYANAEQIIRSGDELLLGSLKIRVKF
ncbi:MAG: FHA domain-containing protein [Anaerolineae bacterium]|nr:FHA domain-containing protein [Anaerolineae bacterium]